MTQFKFTFQSGISLEQIVGFETAGKIWSQFLTDDIEINIHVSMTQELPSTVIGGAIPVYVDTDVEMVQNALGQDVTSSEDELATQNLNVQIGDDGVLRYSRLVGDSTQQSAQMTLTQANAKALGIDAPGGSGFKSDGYIVLNSLQNSPYGWSYDYERTSPAPKGSLDFLSVALHEIGHIMGFTSGIDVMDGDLESLDETTLLDLYRYSDRSLAVNAQELTAGETAYFSVDGGQTNLAAFSEGITAVLGGIEGYQASHWADNALANPIKDTTEVAQAVPSTTDFLSSLFAIAPPATTEDSVDNLNQLLANPNGGSAGLPDFVSLQVDAIGGGGPSLGIMDPTLAPGERSAISALDVLAMDVLGYDLTGASTTINYKKLLEEAEEAIAQKLGISVAALNTDVDTNLLTQNRWQEVLAAMNGSDEVYERRRAKRKTTSKNLWQEEGLDPTVLNIISDGAGDEAEIRAYANHSLITAVEALPYASLFLRTVNLKGDDASDLIIPAYDVYQTIDAGHGDNVVQLGRNGGNVTAGSGHDTILSMGGNVIIDGGDGDNVVVLENQNEVNPKVTVGKGHDYIRTAGNSVDIVDGGGNNIIHVDASRSNITTGDGNDILLVTGDTIAIAAGGGDNHIHAKTGGNSTITVGGGNNHIHAETGYKGTVTVGEGDNHIHLVTGYDGYHGTITAGGGNNHIHAESGGNGTITVGGGDNHIHAETGYKGTITVGGGDNHIYLVTGYGNPITGYGGTITTGDGNNLIQVETGGSANITTGDGNDHIVGGRVSDSIDAGGGNDRISGTNGTGAGRNERDTIITGDGSDIVILGDRYRAYYRGDGTSDYAYITDFSDTDVLQLYGSADDYRIRGTYLLYRGDEIAKFNSNVNLELDGDQVYFVNATAPERDISEFAVSNPNRPTISDINRPTIPDIPTVNDILERVQTYHTTEELPTYSIVGGDDAQFFTIDPYTGDLSWRRVPDGSTPLDANGDNKYDVIVQATLGDGNTERDVDTQRLTITKSSLHNTVNDRETDEAEPSNAIAYYDDDFETDDIETSDSIDQANNDDKPNDIESSNAIFEPSADNKAREEAIVGPFIQDRELTKEVRSISGQVRNDSDGDGDLTDLDGGIAGVTLKLFEDNDRNSRKDGRAIAKTKTDANGFYSFTDLADGNYIVRQIDLNGFTSTADADGRWKGQIWNLTINGDTAFTGQDFLDASTTGL